MFNDRYGLTKAVLEGRKTMTRRFISEDVWQRADVYRHKHYDDTLGLLPGKEALIKFSPFKPSEVVAVAQSYLAIHEEMMDGDYGDAIYDPFRWAIVDDKPGWSNKMFVKADLMPHQIRITNVRVERLQDISDEDCLREGIVEYTCNLYEYRGICYSFEGDKTKMGAHKTPREAFAALIDKVSGKGTWASNPWVFVYEFELVK